MKLESYALGTATMKREGSRPYRSKRPARIANIALMIVLTLLTVLLTFVVVYLVDVSEKLGRMESQLYAVDSQLHRVDALAAASVLAPRNSQRIKESQVVPPPDMDVSRIESRLSLLQYALGGFGPGESVKSKLDELKFQSASCRRL